MSKTLIKTVANTVANTIGWDIGGAHIKVVQLDAKGQVLQALQLPCPLWKGLVYLQRAIADALVQLNLSGTRQPQGLSPQNIPAEAGYSYLKALQIAPYEVNKISTCHAITMTGELVDLFANRHEGVRAIAKVASDLLGENVWFYAAAIVDAKVDTNDGGEIEHQPSFVQAHDVHRNTSLIASANWHASASFLALQVPNALFVDIGSTTTDIIAILNGKVSSTHFSDAARMADDSLVYSGVVRTPVMALAQKLPFESSEINVAAEHFATMADVYRLMGELQHDDAETADGKGKTQLESARRLARMIGHDVDLNLEKWITLAFACRSIQMQQIKTAMRKQLKPNMLIIGAGAGSFLVKAIADDLHYTFKHAYEAASMRGTAQPILNRQPAIDICFPAYAVAYLRLKSTSC